MDIVLAGNVESASFTHAERLCDILRQTLPVCAVTKRVALRDGWGAAKAQLCADHGFAPDRVEKLEVSPFFAGTPRRPHVHRVR